jgi:hypothetical protein
MHKVLSPAPSIQKKQRERRRERGGRKGGEQKEWRRGGGEKKLHLKLLPGQIYNSFLSLISSFIPLWSGKTQEVISFFLCLLRFVL